MNENDKKLKVVKNSENTEDLPAKDEKVCASDCKPAPPSNIYQLLMASMTPQQLANLGVQLIQVNGSELFWLTSVGQLYAFNNKQAALEAEYSWLMSEPSLNNN